ncbi:MAG: hypothetical protein ACK5NY_01555 [Burkholderiaceae bacterium]
MSDDEVASGQLFTNGMLADFMVEAWANYIGAMSKWGLPYTEKESFILVQPHQSYVDVVRSGLPNPGAILEVWAGVPDIVQQIPLSPAPSTDPATGFIQVQPASVAGFQTGDFVSIIQDHRFEGVVNDVWTVTVSGGFLILNGCFATIRNPADYVGANPGWAVRVPQSAWRSLSYSEDYDPGERAAAANLTGEWSYRGQALRLIPPSASQQVLAVTYRITGDSSFVSSDSPVVEDDAARVLVPYLAGVAARAKGQPGAQELLMESVGNPLGVMDGEGGVLGESIALKIKTMQQSPLQKGRFRPKNMALRYARPWLGGRTMLPYA